MSGPVATRRQLDNGLILLHARNEHSAAVSISLSVAGGAALEPADRSGLATLLGRGLTRGTSGRSKADIAEELDYRGALLSGSAGRHSCGLGARARAADLDDVLGLVAECARDAIFPDAEVEKLRGDRLTALREDADDPGTMAMLEFRARAYGPDHPYARRLRGTRESVEALTAKELRAFHRRLFTPGAALLVIVGNVEPDDALRSTRRAFDGWEPAGDGRGFREAMPSIEDAKRLAEPVRIDVPMPAKAQVEMVLGHAGIRRLDDRYYAATVMNSILGSFAMGGRLGRTVREERGMAYHVSSSLGAGPGPGPFIVRAGVQPEHVEGAAQQMVAEIRRIRDEPVTAEELDDARAAIVRSLPRALESNEGVARVLHQIELYDLGLDHIERFPEYLEAVTVESVRAAAESILHPEAMVLVAAGPGVGADVGS